MSRLISRTLVAALLALAAAAAAHAQGRESRAAGQGLSGQIQGQVRYANGGQPVFNVVVNLDSFEGGYVGEVRTDRNGRFSFRGLSPVQYNVTVRLPGYFEERQTVELQTTSSAYLQIQLRADPSYVGTGDPAVNLTVSTAVPAAAQKEFEAGRAIVLADAKDEKKMGEGLQHLEKAVSLYPKYLEAQLLLGTSYMDAKQWDKAEAALRKALELDPKATGALFAIGEVYRHQKKYDEAEKALTEGLRLDEKSAQGQFTLGRVYYEKGDVAKAGPHVGRALQLKPDFAEAYLLAGNILLRARQPENALAQFEEYLRLAPNGEFAPQTRQLAEKIKQALASNKK